MISASASGEAFITFLAQSGRIPREAATRAHAAARATRQPVDVIIRELGILGETVAADEMAKFLDITVLHHMPSASENTELQRLGLDFAAEKAVIPLLDAEKGPLLVVADPFDRDSIDAVSYFFEMPFQLHVAARSLIDDYFLKVRNSLQGGGGSDALESVADVDLERLQDFARDAPVVRFVSRIIQRAVDEKATDIHLEPELGFLRVRFRRDGLLSEVERVSASLHAGTVSRLKIMARLNIAERRLPQDGRLRLPVRGQDVDFRLSVMPSVHGETIVLRVLNRATVQLELEALGFDTAASTQIRSITRRPNGMMLVTGPTGSGKTTTLYSILAELKRPQVKIFTVEDPVEYRIAEVTQMQIDPAIGLTFASALRSVLRQDPDVILVGEIRDRETAQIAVQAALTGHLVLSTLHTNNAVGAFSRLRDMGIEPFLMEATLRGVIGQRLVRKCCPICRGGGNNLDCPQCRGTGFVGRQTTFEILEMSEAMRRLVVEGANEKQMEAAARQEGMVPMRIHARQLAAAGVTTLEEAIRVVELEGS